MEPDGAVEIFCTSVDKYGLIYEDYIGNGDTTTFKEIVDAKPYEKHSIALKKLECVGSIQERFRDRLRVLRKSHQNTKTHFLGEAN